MPETLNPKRRSFTPLGLAVAVACFPHAGPKAFDSIPLLRLCLCLLPPCRPQGG